MAHFLPFIVIAYAPGVGAGIDPGAATQTFTNDCIQLPVIGVDNGGAVVYSTKCVLGVHIGRNERNSGGPSVTDSTTLDDKDRNIWILAEPRRKAASSGTAYKETLALSEPKSTSGSRLNAREVKAAAAALKLLKSPPLARVWMRGKWW